MSLETGKRHKLDEFLAHVQAGIADKTFQKLTLGKLRGDLSDRQNIYIRLLSLRGGTRLSFVHRYPERDVTNNYAVSEGIQIVRTWLGETCFAATLLTSAERIQIDANRRGEFRVHAEPLQSIRSVQQHDRKKNRQLENESFLKQLGILNAEGIPRKEMGDKYRQIHHFIELLTPVVRPLSRDKPLRVVDLASGKGYLTFAVYSFLKQEGFNPDVIGIEKRSTLVDLCNGVARECGFDQIRFEIGEIADASLSGVDVVIALHACDTATDDAIYGGIRSGAEIILVAPCCHKELRRQLQPPAYLAPLFKFGIQMDRMAESITDALRSMYLEASGYATRIQEFISLEHTSKNLLIIASKRSDGRTDEDLFRQASEFRKLFGIKYQRLGDRLRSPGPHGEGESTGQR
jgi:hypothetical protein